MPEYVTDIWQYLKDHDASNWFVIIVSVFVWPTILSIFFFWWNNRTRQSVLQFEVTFTPSRITINGAPSDAIQLDFINRTGSTVYLRGARLKEVPKNFPVPLTASRNMATGKRELAFALPPFQNPQIHYTLYECILQTSSRAIAAIAVERPMNNAFYSYQPGLLRRYFRCPKYFLLEYIVVVGEKKYSVATIF